MATMTASAGSVSSAPEIRQTSKSRIIDLNSRLSDWLEKIDSRAYNAFDGLDSRLFCPLTFKFKNMFMGLQQGMVVSL
jgi:hypothetical protein